MRRRFDNVAAAARRRQWGLTSRECAEVIFDLRDQLTFLKFPEGDRWHVQGGDGKPLCHAHPESAVTVIEVPEKPETICHPCATAWYWVQRQKRKEVSRE